VKLEKLDIMIRLASQANIAQVLSELKEWVTIFLDAVSFTTTVFTSLKYDLH
jgi:vesicle coat complex subunit